MTEYDVNDSAEYASGNNNGVVLTTTLWNQSGNIYVSINGQQTNLGVAQNLYCPLGYNSTTVRTITGCTNTADASVIYYWIEQGYTFEFTATVKDYYELNTNNDPNYQSKFYLSENPDPSTGTLSISDLNSILNDDDLMQTIAAAYKGDAQAIAELKNSQIDLGNFIAALNFFCGAKNHSGYGTSSQGGTWTYWYHSNSSSSNHLVYRALGFDSYNHITVDCGNTSYDTPKMYNASTNEFTEIGHSILQENLDYGEIIRVGIPEHDIYMDGYKIEDGVTYYHLNYGWGGNSSATRWYSVDELKKGNAPQMNSTYGIKYIVIDLSPDINVVVSNAKSEYWGGSFLRGMERVNHIQTIRAGDDAVDFVFADDIGGSDVCITLSSTAKVTSKSDVNFSNINVDLYIAGSVAVQSAYAMNFEFNGGSIIVNNNSSSNAAISETGDQAVTVTLDNSFIYSGYTSGGYEFINNKLEVAGGYYYNTLSSFAATVKGSVLTAGSAADKVVLWNNSALFGSLNLGSGDNTLTVESGSLFYGDFSGTSLTVNLTLNSKETGAMLVMTSTGENAFLKAAGNLLNVSVYADNLAKGGIYTLYAGNQIADVAVNLTIGNKSYGILKMGDTISHDDYTLVYDTESGEIKLAYSIVLARVTEITQTPEKPLDEDGFTNSYVIVKAEFSENTTRKWYKIGENGSWTLYTEDGVKVEENTVVYFMAENGANQNSDPVAENIVCIDKTPPPALEIIPNTTEWTNQNITLSAGFAAGVEVPEDFTYIEYSIDGGVNWIECPKGQTGVELEIENNTTVIFRTYDKRGNYNESSCEISNIDKIAPDVPPVIGSGTEEVRAAYVKFDFDAAGVSTDIKCLEYSLNGTDWYEYTDTTLFGENCTVYFRAVDLAGNISPDTVQYNIENVDNIPPEKPEVFADITHKTNQQVTVTAVFNKDDVVAVEYSLDGNEWFECPNYTVNGDCWVFEYKTGENCTLYFRSKDNVGNVSEVGDCVVNNIDTTPPTAPVVQANETKWTRENIILEAFFDEISPDVVSNQYSFTGKDNDWHDYTGKLEVTENGIVYFRSIDDVGNIAYTEYAVTNIDRTAPALPVILTDSDGRLTNKPIDIRAEFGERRAVKIEYTLNGSDWIEFVQGKAVTGGQCVIAIRAYDKAGNVSAVANAELDNKGMITEMPKWQWSNEDAVEIQYSFNKVDWFSCSSADEIVFKSNGKIYFRAVDEAGNISNVKEYRIDNIDDIADNKSNTKIYIDRSYTAKNTFGKVVDGDKLQYGINAFSSVEDAADNVNFGDNLHVIGSNLTRDDLARLDNVEVLSAITVMPSGSYDSTEYSYKAAAKSEKSVAIESKDYSGLNIKWFKDIAVNNSNVDTVTGGKSEIASKQYYSKDGYTLTRQTATVKSAGGLAVFAGGSNVDDVSGYLNVKLDAASVNKLNGGQHSTDNKSKVTDSEKLYQIDIALKEKVAAAGSVELVRSAEVGDIENYKSVYLQQSSVSGHISSSKDNCSKSENLVNSAQKFTRNIAVTQTFDSDGNLKVENGSVSDIRGYSSVVLNKASVSDISRTAEDGTVYRKQSDNWKIALDLQSGKVTGSMTGKVDFINAGSIAVNGKESSVNTINNYSKVSVTDATVGSISNNIMVKDEKNCLFTWEDIDAYGVQQNYQVDTENAECVVLKSVEKYAANGTVKISSNSTVGEISGYNKVVLSGNGSVGSIAAVSSINDEIMSCGAYEFTYTDNVKNKNGIAASGTLKESIVVKAAASAEIDGYTVNGSVSGYKAVTTVDAQIAGNVELCAVYSRKDETTFNTVKGIVTKTYSSATTYTNNGSAALSYTVIDGNLTGYAKVVMNYSTAGDIVNNIMVKTAEKYSETWDALDLQIDPENTMLLDTFIHDPCFGNLLSRQLQAAANGSIELKNNSTAGNIIGYNSVKLTGSANNDELSVGAIKASDSNFGARKYDMTAKYSDGECKQTINVKAAPAASVTVADYSVNGDIVGYKTVKLVDTNVAGNIDRGVDYTEKSTITYSADQTTFEQVVTYTASGAFSADGVVAGNIDNYNKVELKNSAVGDIYQSDIIKTVTTEVWDCNMLLDSTEDHVYKLSGSVSITDSTAGSISNYQSVVLNNGSAGDLSNVAKVSASGLFNRISSVVATENNDSITVNKKSVLCIENSIDLGDGAKDVITVNGTLVLGDNFASLEGLDSFAGKGVIAASNAVWDSISGELVFFEGTMLALGQTSTGFRGIEFEAADDNWRTAFEWDGQNAYEGWLGDGNDCDFADTIDYIRLVADDDAQLTITGSDWSNGSSDVVRIGDEELQIANGTITYDLTAGCEYLIEINRKDDNSMSYTMSIA